MGSRCCSFLRLHVWSVLILIVAGWNIVWADFRDGEEFDITKITPMVILEIFQELPLESLFYVYFDTVNKTELFSFLEENFDYETNNEENFDYETENFLLTKGYLATVGVIDQSRSHGYDEDTLHTIQRFNNLNYPDKNCGYGSYIAMCNHSVFCWKSPSKRISLAATLPVFANIVEQYYFEPEDFEGRGVHMLDQMDMMLHMIYENECHNDFTIKNIIDDIRQRAEEHRDPKALQLWRELHTTIKPRELWGLCHCCQQGIVFQGNTWCGITNFLTLKPVIRKMFGQREESKKQRYIRLCKKYHENFDAYCVRSEEEAKPFCFRAIEWAPPGCKDIAFIKGRTQWHIAQLRSIKETANMLCVGTASIASFCTCVGLAKLAFGI